jgi:hypothetical protein
MHTRPLFLLTLLPALAAAAAPEPVQLPPVPQKTVDQAIKADLIRFNRDFKGGAHTDDAFGGGNSIVLALAAYQGNTSADKRLLEQLRLNLKGKYSISANGGYPAQHERHVTGMYVIVKRTPRIYNQLSDEEKHAMDLVSKAALVGSAYTTSDASYANGNKPTAIDGDDNLNRGWNPNFREGMIGAMITGAVYFGPEEAQKILDTYNHEEFVKQLKDAGLTNTWNTFNWKTAHPDSKAPTGQQIAANIKNYRYNKQDLSDPFQYYYDLTMNTYGAKVNAGLNGGKGKDGAGMIASGADQLPNLGKPGMLLEFDSKDAGGPRSSIHYAYDGFRPNLTNHLIVLIGGYWPTSPNPKADEILSKMNVGITDLFYKLDHGYIDYSKAHASKNKFDKSAKGWNFEVQRSLWQDVIKPYHERH